jgi:hypothetical protein
MPFPDILRLAKCGSQPTSSFLQPASFALLAFYFQLFTQTVCALLEMTNGFDSYSRLQGESILCTIAHKFIDNLKDDSVCNSC